MTPTIISNPRRQLPMVILLLLAAVVGILSPPAADAHRHGSAPPRAARADHGHEASGIVAAWLLAAANLTVALGLLTRGARRLRRLSPAARNRLERLNRAQKKILRPLHYWLNPVGVAAAGSHFLLSTCRATALPEWGFYGLLGLAASGLVLRFMPLPASAGRRLRRLHTHPAIPTAIVAILIAGHGIID